MQNITSIDELKNAIQILEVEQNLKGNELKEKFFLIYESFKPVNIISSTLSDIAKSPFLIDNIIGTAMGLATGYFSKSLFIGSSANRVRRLIGTVLQFGITNIIAQNSGSIKSFGRSFFQKIFHKRIMNSEKP